MLSHRRALDVLVVGADTDDGAEIEGKENTIGSLGSWAKTAKESPSWSLQPFNYSLKVEQA